jgi:hypothetical protein
MDSTEITRDRPIARWPDADAAPGATPDPVDAQLQLIVEQAGRRAPVRRALRRAGHALARWLDNLAPPAAASKLNDDEPVYRFPFF